MVLPYGPWVLSLYPRPTYEVESGLYINPSHKNQSTYEVTSPIVRKRVTITVYKTFLSVLQIQSAQSLKRVKKMAKTITLVLLIFFLSILHFSNAKDEAFDVRKHLSTVSRFFSFILLFQHSRFSFFFLLFLILIMITILHVFFFVL